MIIRGHYIADVPYFAAHLRSQWFEGVIWFLADTGAARTTLIDRDVRYLEIPHEALEPAEIPIMGIGGSVKQLY